MKRTLIILCMLGATLGHGFSQLIGEERRIRWDPGIPGGIPEITGPVQNIVDHGADPTGVLDSRNAIVSALAALPSSGGVVFIPQGTFRVRSKITVSKDRVVFRGTGRKSRLLLASDGDCVEVVTYQRGNWQPLADGASRDSLSVVVQNGSLFTPGAFAEIEQDNDSLLMYTQPEWIVSWGENSVGQLFEVEAVQGNRVTFRSPVHLDFSTELNARIRPQGLVRHVGFEDLYLEKTTSSGHTLLFKNAAYCWVRNVESNHTRRTHVHQTVCLGNEIRDSYFHRSFSYGGGGSGYGVECGAHVTSCLVENNIFDSLRHAMIIQVGANGNVYGYNYSINPVQGDGETNLNVGWIPPDISIHGHYPFMNLFEGNEVEEVGIGDYWGPAGPGNTYFRNRVKGDGILYYDASHGQNVIGNLTTRLLDQSGKSAQKLEHGNVVGGTVRWDPGIPERELPFSYYLDSVPAFFGEATWPPFGPDVALPGKLPAQVRFENLPYLLVEPDRNPVPAYEKLEFTIRNGKVYDNPFDPDEVDVSGTFFSPLGDTLLIHGFWDGNTWRLRFAGGETGEWSYAISVTDRDGREEQQGRFQVTPSGQRGWIRPSSKDPHYLVHDDGTPFYGIGMAVPWLVYDERYYDQPGLLASLKGYGVNFINWLFTSWDILLLRDSYHSYSMEDALRFDQLLADAEAQGIKLLLGIWIHDLLRDAPHPWSGFYDWDSNPFNQLTPVSGFFSDSTSWEFQKKYYRYIIARWGYSPSVAMWHLVAEINGTNAIYDPYAMENDERGWHNRINRYFTHNDPFGHPTSVSGSGGFDFSKGWEITGVPQAHEYPYPADRIRENPDRIAYWADRLFRGYGKPALIGEFGKSRYEEGISESFLHNGIWAGLMSGASATPLHWWGGQIASRPENFSTFNPLMLEQLTHLKGFLEGTDMAAQGFTPLYGAPEGERIALSEMAGGMAYGLKGDSLHLCWVYHVHERSATPFSGVGVAFPGLPEGTYDIAFYDTWEGSWLSGSSGIETGNGILRFTCPDFTGDIAIRITHAGPPGATGQARQWGREVRIFPNPCRSTLNIEGMEHGSTLRLLDITGKVLAEQGPARQSLSQLDLSGFSNGIYLLEVENASGMLRTFRVLHLA